MCKPLEMQREGRYQKAMTHTAILDGRVCLPASPRHLDRFLQTEEMSSLTESSFPPSLFWRSQQCKGPIAHHSPTNCLHANSFFLHTSNTQKAEETREIHSCSKMEHVDSPETVILKPTDENIRLAAERLGLGKLVAFPTETVYGLGGNALSEKVVEKIYATKGRPATDPLICHVDSLERVMALWDQSWDPAATALARSIGESLWPGPLTIVCKAHPSLPVSVTGGSGYVGARIPRHAVTLRLLSLVDFPLAGPSANTFGHVSPTTAQHVYDDLAVRDKELRVLDGGSCAVGIESTVVKVNGVDRVEVLRRGRITVSQLQGVIAARFPNTRVDIRDTRSKFTGADQPMDGPGQMLTHYAPAVPCSLVTPAGVRTTVPSVGPPSQDGGADCEDSAPPAGACCVQRGHQIYPLGKTVIVDFGGILSRFKSVCLAYRDLSVSGDVGEACSDVFEALRWTERVQGAEAALFPFLSEWPDLAQFNAEEELLAAVEDRLFRAASGTTALVLCASPSK